MFQSGLCSSSELETSRGSIRIQHLTGSSHGMEASTSRFPRLEECAHFHYEFAEIGPLQVKQSPHSWYLVIIIFCDFRLSSARTQRTRGSQGPRSILWLCPLKNLIIGPETSKFSKFQLGLSLTLFSSSDDGWSGELLRISSRLTGSCTRVCMTGATANCPSYTSGRTWSTETRSVSWSSWSSSQCQWRSFSKC